jgi:hypothetical protein
VGRSHPPVSRADQIAEASSLEDLRKITFNADVVEISLSIQDALYPEGGIRAAHFVGLRAGELKRIIQARFNEAKKLRGQELARGSGKSGKSSGPYYDWTADLKTDKDGAVLPLLTNLILFLRHRPKWQGVLAFDEFANRVVIRKSPPWGSMAADTVLTDHLNQSAHLVPARRHQGGARRCRSRHPSSGA